MESIIFESNRIRVRNLKRSDIPIITRWWNDGLLMKDMGFVNGMGVTESSLFSRFEKQLIDDDTVLESRMFIITDIATGKEIGELQYGELDLISKKCRIAIKISEIDYQGKGLGKEALSLFIDYLVAEFDLKKIEIDTIHKNIRAYNLYKNLGFVETERIKDYWTDDQGNKHDIIFMEKIVSN
jgi:RimJ/RimL family protein N-acetyltransferase